MNTLDPNRYEEKRGRGSNPGQARRSTDQSPATAAGHLVLMFVMMVLTAGGALALIAAAPGGINWPAAGFDPGMAGGPAFQGAETATADILQAQLRATANAAAATEGGGAAQAEIDARRLQAEQTATADILQAQLRATANAAASTQGFEQTQVQVGADALRAQESATADVLLAQLRATTNAAISTQSAGATLTQQSIDAGAALIGTAVAGTATAIAQSVAVETQAVAATDQRRAEQAQADVAEQARTTDFLWSWGPTLLVITLLSFGVWAFWHWEVRRRTPPAPTFEPPPPAAPPIRQPLKALAKPEELPGRLRRLTASNDPVSGWLADIKRKLLPGGKEQDDNPDA